MIPVKQALVFVEEFLARAGLQARRMYSPTHPNLSPEELRQLFSKIPRPCNPEKIEVVYDGVDWFHTGAPQPHPDTPMRTNAIRVVRYRGTDFFRVEFHLELTDPSHPEAPRNSAPALEAARAYFGKLSSYGLVCVPSEAEVQEMEKMRRQAAPLVASVEAQLEDLVSAPLKTSKAQTWEALAKYAGQERESISVKEPLKKAFPKPYQYTYDGTMRMTKRTLHGYELCFTADNPPAHFHLNCNLSLRGYDFHYSFASKQFVQTSQDDINDIVVLYRTMADMVESALDAPLFDIFGKTPDWYF